MQIQKGTTKTENEDYKNSRQVTESTQPTTKHVKNTEERYITNFKYSIHQFVLFYLKF